MKSTSGHYWIALDHVRAIAVFIVFTWHFIHAGNGYPVNFSYNPIIPFNILDEGHTAVSLFMCLSGYIFAKLLNNKNINYANFIWNRFIRLCPLLFVVIIVYGLIKYITDHELNSYLSKIALGFIFPTLPNGGWSITVEYHFYILLPLVLFAKNLHKYALSMIILLSILIKCLIYLKYNQIHMISYYTIVGRIDQFLFGILFFHNKDYISNNRFVIIFSSLLFFAFYWLFDLKGGFYNLNNNYPSTSPLWIILPSIEGAFYSVVIAFYDANYNAKNNKMNEIFAKIGQYSYSIYIIHLFFVFDMARFVNIYIMDISNFYIACIWSAICFILTMPIYYFTYNYIEKPFFRFRLNYIRSSGEKTLIA